jgi:hypothetical protein
VTTDWLIGPFLSFLNITNMLCVYTTRCKGNYEWPLSDRVGKCSEMQHLPDRVKYTEEALLKEMSDQQTKYVNN